MTQSADAFYAELRSAPGRKFGIDRELHGHGMSRVVLPRELALHRRVVIRTLAPDCAATVSDADALTLTGTAIALDPIIDGLVIVCSSPDR